MPDDDRRAREADERRAANDRRVAEDIRQYGCHLISVFDPEATAPGFTYSVGIHETCRAPEAIVIGLRASLGASLLNAYHRRVRAGEVFRRGTPYTGFLDGFAVYVEPARPAALTDYTLGCARYYGGRRVPTVQIVWPSTDGVWPWQARASEALRGQQPMLGRKRPDRA